MAVLLGGVRKTESADAAAEIRKVLKMAFPKIKFSVRKRSGGNSISIDWENGPTVKEVQSYTRDFEMGSFDGMTDSYSYNNRNTNIPQIKYLFWNRYMSKNLEKYLRDEIERTYDFSHLKNEYDKENFIYRIMREDFGNTSLPAGINGIKSYRACLKKEFHKLKPKRKYSPKQKVAIALNECRPML